ncbi:GNAT family N-acetyltransferase [Streptomyces cavernicola]|uniref:GNAT family N-acetyltransferase n=1 Tax=Streptomyces cavernicola TaxID=3043613 RepID=A0ABT6SKR6_9ACTN|nr:GNAT family N-acetyltransferase [Streptomyces sp. B-S-A6]MDI3408247.1 GNAT family N-acetyltransferase [Streptomyces sp. B-S-A6]
MSPVRRATPEDAEELIRLRKIMLDSLRPSDDIGWQAGTARHLRTELARPDGDLMATVVDDPTAPGRLAACATGKIEHRLGSPDNPDGAIGYVFNVCTDPTRRRRGHSRACMRALLDWYAERGIRKVDLTASPEAESLYTSLGFHHMREPAMRLLLPGDGA